MRFLTDQDVYAVTAQLLQNLGHDVATAAGKKRRLAPFWGNRRYGGGVRVASSVLPDGSNARSATRSKRMTKG